MQFFLDFGSPWGPKMEPKCSQNRSQNPMGHPMGSQEAPEVILGTILGVFWDPSGDILGPQVLERAVKTANGSAWQQTAANSSK